MDDLIIKRTLRRWAAHHPSPSGGRGLLIVSAAAPRLVKSALFPRLEASLQQRPADQYYMAFTWSILSSLQSGPLGLRLCL